MSFEPGDAHISSCLPSAQCGRTLFWVWLRRGGSLSLCPAVCIYSFATEGPSHWHHSSPPPPALDWRSSRPRGYSQDDKAPFPPHTPPGPRFHNRRVKALVQTELAENAGLPCPGSLKGQKTHVVRDELSRQGTIPTQSPNKTARVS